MKLFKDLNSGLTRIWSKRIDRDRLHDNEVFSSEGYAIELVQTANSNDVQKLTDLLGSKTHDEFERIKPIVIEHAIFHATPDGLVRLLKCSHFASEDKKITLSNLFFYNLSEKASQLLTNQSVNQPAILNKAELTSWLANEFTFFGGDPRREALVRLLVDQGADTNKANELIHKMHDLKISEMMESETKNKAALEKHSRKRAGFNL